jgi:putative sigma-54 modulation protein
MEIRINSVKFDHSEQLESFIQKKVSKLDKFYDNIIKAEVVLKVVKPETAENKMVEIKLTIPNAELFAEKVSDSFEQGIDLVVEAVKKQLSKQKAKVKKA